MTDPRDKRVRLPDGRYLGWCGSKPCIYDGSVAANPTAAAARMVVRHLYALAAAGDVDQVRLLAAWLGSRYSRAPASRVRFAQLAEKLALSFQEEV